MSDSGTKPSQMRTWIWSAVAGVLLFMVAATVFVGALWAVSQVADDREVLLAASVVFGLVFLLAIISGIVAAFSALRLTSTKSALGLPEGSIRAIIALILVLIFVIMAIYLIEAVFIGQNANEDARNAATQLLATLGTLVAAVAAFYFGSGAVTTGTVAATAVANAARRVAPPVAITKGSTAADAGPGYVLVGVVNPRGRETKYYFEYGDSGTYGNATPPASAGAGEADLEVRSAAIPDVQNGWHLRLVATSDAGTTYGKDSVVGGDS